MDTFQSELGVNTAVKDTLHAFVPSHTPHASTLPLAQHCPDGGSELEQHFPNTSTTTPPPPHTPHASTGAVALQHRPAASTVAPDSQHPPVTLSTAPVVQHTPCTSTTPPHVAASDVVRTTGAAQVGPAHPVPHTHSPSDPQVYELFNPTEAQSALTMQGQADTTHASAPTGSTPLAAHRDVVSVAPLSLNTHCTSRTRVPGPHCWALPKALTAEQAPHGPADHSAVGAGHENRLHGRTADG